MSFENFCIVSQGNLDFKFQKIKIAIEDIVMLQADSNYTHVYLSDGKRFIFARTIKLFEDMLKDYSFVCPRRRLLLRAVSFSCCNE